LFKVLILALVLTSSLFSAHYISHGKKETLTKLSTLAPLSKNRTNQSKISYYKTASGERVGIDKKIIVSFKDLSIQLYIEKEFSLQLIQALGEDMFLYRVKEEDDTLTIANTLATTKGVRFAHPDFIVQKRVRTNDPLFDATWHLFRNPGINVEQAWQYTKGKGIVVGVYDEGIDLEHEDLRENIIGYGNFNNPTGQIDMVQNAQDLNNNLENAPAPATNTDYNWHGTSCAGLIAATGDNNRGSVGVAPESKLLALRYANSNISRDIAAFRAMALRNSAIISNSWGTYNMNEAFERVLQELSQTGRNGKGILIFFAAGNDGCNLDQYYQANPDGSHSCKSSSAFAPIHDESESPYVISIAASTQDNRIETYSNYGSSIDFTAPGAAIITTDAMGFKGAPDAWNYTDTFSGTSAAAPIAAGAAALILSANPALSKEEVLDILKITAHRENQRHYDSRGNLVISRYDANGRNDHWGYGLIDAGAAVALASTYGKKSSFENFAHKIYKDMH
jgi:subtilisin family serine protease